MRETPLRQRLMCVWAFDAIVFGPLCHPLQSDPDSSCLEQPCRRMLRHAGASRCLCGGSGPACHRRHSFVGPIAGRRSRSGFRQSGLERGHARASAFAVSQFDFAEKTETYEILRHPGSGRKDILRGAAAEGKATPKAGRRAQKPVAAAVNPDSSNISCTASAASADWVTGAENPRLRGTF